MGWNYPEVLAAVRRGELDASGWREVRRRARSAEADAQFLMGLGDLSERTRRQWLRKAAEQDHAEACFELSGGGTRALRWLHRAAELGFAAAQSCLGCHFAWVPDMEQSRHWYLQAALQGEPEAMYEIGFVRLLGEGGPPDPVEAVAWLEKSAQAEPHTYTDDARRLLLQLYSEGCHGVAKDPARARYWRQRQVPRPKDPIAETSRLLHARDVKALPADSGDEDLVLLEYMLGTPQVDVVAELLRRGANPNFALPGPHVFHSSTALSWSTSNLEIVRLLVEAGAKVQLELRQGRIVSVHEACRHGRLDVLRFLIEEADGRAALEFFDVDHWTPLITSAAYGQEEVVDYLLGLGVDPNLCRYDAALDVAVLREHWGTARRLAATGAWTLLEFAGE